MTSKTIIAYKALNEDFTCRGHKFEVGETYAVSGKVMACENGFHACENPFDVLDYYDITTSRFAIVEQGGEKDARHDGKIASEEITIKAELSLSEYVKQCVLWLCDNLAAPGGKKNSSYTQLVASGNRAQLAASGVYAQIAASGNRAKLAASGKDSVISSSSHNARAKGADGTWISLAEYGIDGTCVGFANGCIGQGGLKPDTWYRAENGRLVEA